MSPFCGRSALGVLTSRPARPPGCMQAGIAPAQDAAPADSALDAELGSIRASAALSRAGWGIRGDRGASGQPVTESDVGDKIDQVSAVQ